MTTTTRDLVIATLKAARGPMTVGELARHTEKSETTVRDALKALNGDVVKVGDSPALYQTREEKPVTERRKYRGTPGSHQATKERDDRVLLAVQQTGGASLRDLSGELGVDDALVYYSLFRLRRSGDVVKTRTGSRTPLYTPAN